MNLYTPSMRKLPGYTYRSGSNRILQNPLNLGLLILGLLFAGSSSAIEETACIDFKAIDVKVNALLDSSAAFELVSSVEDRCIDAQLIRDLRSRIPAYFIEQGYVTTRPYLLEQDISDSEIDICEGAMAHPA